VFHLDVKKGQGCIVICRGEKGVGCYKKNGQSVTKGQSLTKATQEKT